MRSHDEELERLLERLRRHTSAQRDIIEFIKKQKDDAYSERDQLVAHLSTLYESHLTRHPDSDTAWDRDWRWIVCVHGPAGQMTWHIHDSELPMFDHLGRRPGDWDGHTTEQKYQRLAAIGDRSKKCHYGQ